MTMQERQRLGSGGIGASGSWLGWQLWRNDPLHLRDPAPGSEPCQVWLLTCVLPQASPGQTPQWDGVIFAVLLSTQQVPHLIGWALGHIDMGRHVTQHADHLCPRMITSSRSYLNRTLV